jgi:hypothetical protein
VLNQINEYNGKPDFKSQPVLALRDQQALNQGRPEANSATPEEEKQSKTHSSDLEEEKKNSSEGEAASHLQHAGGVHHDHLSVEEYSVDEEDEEEDNMDTNNDQH